MRVACKSCGYVSPSMQDYFRHLVDYPECSEENPIGVNDNMKGARPSRKERKRLATQANQKVQQPFTRFDKQETVGQALTPNYMFKEGANPEEISVPRPIGFMITPSRK